MGIKTMIGMLALVAGLAGGCVTPIVNLGYNALETAGAVKQKSEETSIRNRLLTNAGIDTGPLQVNYSGLNEISSADAKTYFGRNLVAIGNEHLSACSVARTNSYGFIDHKVGVRNTSLLKLFGGFGSIEATADKDSANISAFVGYPIGSVSLGAFNSVEVPFNGLRPSNYTELQVSYNVCGPLSLFGRVEVPNFDKEQVTGLAGITVDIGKVAESLK